jgi:CheY-like chemotaxis protein
MGGWEVTAKLKSDERTRHIPVVILTAHALEGVSTVIESGCEGFLIKPCLPEDLVKEIVRVLGRQSQNSNSASDPVRAATP